MFEIGKTYEGFKLNEISLIDEIKSVLYHFQHEKTEADLIYIANDDTNKVFSIAFKTPVSDNTGVAHIIEHSVLNGSKKYPLKEPFVELLKGSLKTFLNAMTYPDKTVYPVASTNETDFLNLIDVYLDAVFNPLIHENEYVFMQEGWHYHLEDKGDELSYNGVVFNEMKGVYSSPDEILVDTIFQTLYSDTTYRFSSGGEPTEIPTLTYEGFKNFHQTFYHPSNSVLYFYGNGDIEKHLNFIDKEYLNGYEKSARAERRPTQKKLDTAGMITKYYPITAEEEMTGKDILNLSYAISDAHDAKTRIGMQILTRLLFNYPSSPVRTAFNASGIGKEISGFYETDIYYYTLIAIARDCREDGAEAFYTLVDQTLSKLVQEGIDADLIDAALNMYEFLLKDVENSSVPKGLHYNLDILDSLMYGGDAKMYLKYNQYLDEIKKEAHHGYFEALIEKYLLNNRHQISVVLKPQKGIAEKREEEQRTALKEKQEALSDSETAQIVEKTLKLKEIQNTPDKPEALKKIPVLPLSEITPPKARELKREGNVYLYNEDASDIIYMQAYYDISEIAIEKYHYAALLGACLTQLATQKYNFEDLNNAIQINTGGLDFEATINKNLITDEPVPQFVLRLRFFEEKAAKAMELLDEIFYRTRFDDRQRLYEIVAEEAASEKSKLMFDARGVLHNRLTSYISPSGALKEYMQGIDYYYFIDELYTNFDTKIDEAIAEMKKIYQAVFSDANVELLFSSDEAHNPLIFNTISRHFKACEANTPKVNISFTPQAKNEALIISTDVNYVGKAYDFKKAGYRYSGPMLVLKTIMHTDYLWNNVRVKGGAYGAFFTVDRTGGITVSSYRDPHIKRTFDVIDNIARHLETTSYTKEAIHKFIIGTISSIDIPVPPIASAQREYLSYKYGITYEERMKNRSDILACTTQDIRNFAQMFDKMKAEQHYLCAVSNKSAATKERGLFDEMKNLIK